LSCWRGAVAKRDHGVSSGGGGGNRSANGIGAASQDRDGSRRVVVSVVRAQRMRRGRRRRTCLGACRGQPQTRNAANAARVGCFTRGLKAPPSPGSAGGGHDRAPFEDGVSRSSDAWMLHSFRRWGVVLRLLQGSFLSQATVALTARRRPRLPPAHRVTSRAVPLHSSRRRWWTNCRRRALLWG
jgi:hypothetical protein